MTRVKMRTFHILLLIWLSLLSRVSAEISRAVIATIPSEALLQNVATERSDDPLTDEESRSQAMVDLEVTGFITKNGDIFELPVGRSMGSIEAREKPELETGMTMCRYGTIVVYSDSDCNTFFRPSELLARPLKSKIQTGNESEEDYDTGSPVNKRKPNKNKSKNKKRNNKNHKKQQRRKALRKKKNQKRRRNKLKNGDKRGNNSQKKNKKRVNKNRRGNNVNKRRRISKGDGRSDETVKPLQFTILLNRH